jgi:hypothetical protein
MSSQIGGTSEEHRSMTFNHMGIPMTGSFDREIDLPHLKMTVGNHKNNPFGIIIPVRLIQTW